MPTTAPLEIPGFVPAWTLFADAAQLLTPKRRISVSQAAEEFRILDNPGGGYSGPWQNARAPYTVRPMDCLVDDRYALVVVMGPGQSGKSEIGNNWVLHTVVEDPANMLWLGPDKALVRSYVIEKINPMIRLSAEMRKRQYDTASADNIHSKEYGQCQRRQSFA